MSEISVIMAVYNGERFLQEAIESVLAQTYKSFELVIVDDGSSDRTASILEQYAKLDPRVRVFHQANQGPAAARNMALSMTRNSLVAVMDADDRMLPNRVERQLAFYNENQDASVICSYSYIINSKGERIGVSKNDLDVAAGIRELNPARFSEIVHPSVMMKKDDVMRLGGYNGGFTPIEDRELWGRLVTSGKLIKCQKECLMEYRLHGSSLTMWDVFKPRAKGRSVDINVIRRLKGEQELSVQQVEEMLNARPLLQRWEDGRGYFALKLYKNATRMYAERHLVKFSLLFTVAALLKPVNTIRRALNKRKQQ
jgi:glycosyltransferase involved in cell wall biosynthesis